MKPHLFFLVCISIFLTACDVIEKPILEQGVYRQDLYGPVPEFTQPSEPVQNVLLEDFTGHTCGYCPIGNQTASEILENHQERVSVLGIHSGSLGAPYPPQYPGNWVTPEGTYYLMGQVGVDEMPKGRINRIPVAGTVFSPSVWATKVAAALNATPLVGLQLVASYSPENDHLNVHVNSHWFSNAPGEYRLVILLIESGIIAPQLWYGHEPSEYVPDYEHNHMLRTSISGATGLPVAIDPTTGQNKTNSFTINWNNNWIPENCEVVAFITEGDTGPVLNSTKQKLIE